MSKIEISSKKLGIRISAEGHAAVLIAVTAGIAALSLLILPQV